MFIFKGKPYRYFYAISSDVDAENPGTVRKKMFKLITIRYLYLLFQFQSL